MRKKMCSHCGDALKEVPPKLGRCTGCKAGASDDPDAGMQLRLRQLGIAAADDPDDVFSEAAQPNYDSLSPQDAVQAAREVQRDRARMAAGKAISKSGEVVDVQKVLQVADELIESYRVGKSATQWRGRNSEEEGVGNVEGLVADIKKCVEKSARLRRSQDEILAGMKAIAEREYLAGLYKSHADALAAVTKRAIDPFQPISDDNPTWSAVYSAAPRSLAAADASAAQAAIRDAAAQTVMETAGRFGFRAGAADLSALNDDERAELAKESTEEGRQRVQRRYAAKRQVLRAKQIDLAFSKDPDTQRAYQRYLKVLADSGQGGEG
jgi:hypothetical protein